MSDIHLADIKKVADKLWFDMADFRAVEIRINVIRFHIGHFVTVKNQGGGSNDYANPTIVVKRNEHQIVTEVEEG